MLNLTLEVVSSFRKHRPSDIQFDVNGTYLNSRTYRGSRSFAKHFQSVYNTSSPGREGGGSHSGWLSSDSLPLPPTSRSNILTPAEDLSPVKSVRLDAIIGFVINCCSKISSWLLTYILFFSLPGENFSSQWQKRYCTYSKKKGNSSSASNYRPIALF